MMRAAREALAAAARPPLLIAVTILTSLDKGDLERVGLQGSVLDNVERLAALAKACGLDGVVCSALEAPRLRAAHGAGFKLVTPGIWLAGAAPDDQSRVVTPREALRLGADYLVIGRPIAQAADPVAVLQSIRSSLMEETQ
jgi:orotidine-5'-phosphate decarboxylase